MNLKHNIHKVVQFFALKYFTHGPSESYLKQSISIDPYILKY